MVLLIETAKQFFSATETNVRMAYGRHPTRYLRQSVFFGSTNTPDFLKDQSGNRRFWPIEVRVNQIDTEKLKAEVQLIWAEAVQMYLDMRAEKPYGDLPLYLTDADAQAEAAEHQEQALRSEEADAVSEHLAELLAVPVPLEDEFTTAAAGRDAKMGRITKVSPGWLQKQFEGQKVPVQTITSALIKMGWIRTGKKERLHGMNTHTYIPGPKVLAAWAEEDAEKLV